VAGAAGWERLRSYQQRAALRLASGEHVGLWMSAGTGKSATALAALSHIGPGAFPALIVTRAIGRHAWPRDSRWALEEPVSELWGGKAYSKSGVHRDGTFSSLEQALGAARMVVTNYEVLGARFDELRRIAWRTIIFDESHELKMGFSLPKKYDTGQRKLRRFEYADRLATICHARGGRVWSLSATPVRDRIRDLWGQLRVTLPDAHPLWLRGQAAEEAAARGVLARFEWLSYFCGGHMNEWGGFDTTGAAHLDELKAYIGQRFTLETRQSIAAELPALQRDVRAVTPSARVGHLGGGVEEALARAAEAKAPFAVDLAMDYLGDCSRVVLVTGRRAANTELAAQVRGACNMELRHDLRARLWLQAVTGETDPITRARICAEFNSWPGPAVLVATMGSIGTSVDLHHAQGLIYCALPYTPHDLEQTEGRVGRLGGDPCTIHYLVAEGTVDEQIRMLVLDKLDAVQQVGADTQGEGGAHAAISGMIDEVEVLEGLNAWLAQL